MLRMDFKEVLRSVESGANPEVPYGGGLGGHSALSWATRFAATIPLSAARALYGGQFAPAPDSSVGYAKENSVLVPNYALLDLAERMKRLRLTGSLRPSRQRGRLVGQPAAASMRGAQLVARASFVSNEGSS